MKISFRSLVQSNAREEVDFFFQFTNFTFHAGRSASHAVECYTYTSQGKLSSTLFILFFMMYINDKLFIIVKIF
jgi:hypothetical protein